jgi:hypothetical protein
MSSPDCLSWLPTAERPLALPLSYQDAPMNLYQCFFQRAVGEVAEFVVIEADDDAHACIKADDIVQASASYLAVEVRIDSRVLGQIERVESQATSRR